MFTLDNMSIFRHGVIFPLTLCEFMGTMIRDLEQCASINFGNRLNKNEKNLGILS
jgi:hypothetical protein